MAIDVIANVATNCRVVLQFTGHLFILSLLEIKTEKILCLIKKHLIFYNYFAAYEIRFIF
jgi:hypothetical protein